MTGAAEALAEGAAALENGDWEAARAAFTAALAQQSSASALIGLADASWWLGDMAGTIDNLERAYATARRAGDHRAAAEAAIRLSEHYAAHLGHPSAAGWLARAERLADDHGLAEFQGQLLVGRANFAEDPELGEELARSALDLARASADADLELLALSTVGALLVEQGRVAAGIALLDEAMAGFRGGEPSHLDTFVLTVCISMTSCARCADFERALLWVRAAEKFAQRYGCPFLYAECRTLSARLHFAVGQWDRAEETAVTAIELSRGSVPVYFASAMATLAELRVAQGRWEEAQRLLSGLEGHPPVVPVSAQLALVRGEPALAAEMISGHLDSRRPTPLEGAQLKELLGEAELAVGHADAAATLGAELVTSGRGLGCRIIEARGERLVGRALGDADPVTARRHLDRALNLVVELGMPYEAARTRLALAEVVRAAAPAVASAEARAALTEFDRLGATAGANAAGALLRGLGLRTPSRPAEAGRVAGTGTPALSRRETEVLALVAEGLSNPEIAARLFLSRKTVEHHVANVLAKLGLRNRAEAAAHVIRMGWNSAQE